MENKIYISLKEAENLVFNKLIVIPQERLQIERAQKDWSIAVFADKERLLEYKNQIILLAGSVLKYEIPQKEENLFLNHYRLPKGMILLADRKYRESKNVNIINYPEENNYTEELKFFKSIRRGVIQCYALAINNSISNEFTKQAISIINNINNLSSFNFSFVKALILNEFYPIKERNDGNFYPEAVKRFNWFGAYVFKEFPGINDLKENDLNEAKQWLLNFKNKEDIASIKKALENVPDIFFEEFEFLIGYYIATSFYEEANIGEDYYHVIVGQLKNIKLNKNSKVLFWAIFFQAIFKDDLDYLYVIPSLQEQQQRFEYKIIELVLSEVSLSNMNLEMITLPKKEAIAEYLQLQDGGELTEPKFISKENQKELLDNNFSSNKISNIGFETDVNTSFSNLFPNKCTINRMGFALSLVSKPSDITFYISESSKVKEWLKDLKVKTKHISKLIDNNKKALVGFLQPESYERSLLKVYEWIINNVEKPIAFKTVVIVLMVDEDAEYIQSPKFQNKKLEMEMFCKSKFGDNTTILVKNKRVKSDGEIKRNLKHLLEQFSIKDIELINENIDDNVSNWVLNVNNEFVNESEISDYHTFINR